MPRPPSSSILCRHRRGFTLIELMTVVVILGVLAAVAVGAYSRHVRNAHRTEVMADLSNLTLRQKSFMAVTGRYASSTDSEDITYPVKSDVTAATQPVQWQVADAGYTAAGKSGLYFQGGGAVHGFDALRFLPENGQSWCGYGTISGWGQLAGEVPPFASTLAAEVFPQGNVEEQRYYARDWFYSFALCDFDHDGEFWAFTTAHYESKIHMDDSKDLVYKKGE